MVFRIEALASKDHSSNLFFGDQVSDRCCIFAYKKRAMYLWNSSLAFFRWPEIGADRAILIMIDLEISVHGSQPPPCPGPADVAIFVDHLKPAPSPCPCHSCRASTSRSLARSRHGCKEKAPKSLAGSLSCGFNNKHEHVRAFRV